MRRCFYTGMLLYKKKLLHTNAWALLHADAFTQRCFYRGVLLHARAFTQSLFWHKLAFTLTEDFTLNTITQRCSSHRKTFVQRRLFRRIHFYKEDFCMDTFTERCFLTQVLLHRTHLGRGTLTWVRLETRFGGGFKPFGNQVSIHVVFTERCVYIQGLPHREGPSHRDGFTQRDDFTKACF